MKKLTFMWKKTDFLETKNFSDFFSHNTGKYFFSKKKFNFYKKDFFDIKTCFPKILSSFHFCMRKSQTVGWNDRIQRLLNFRHNEININNRGVQMQNRF